MQQVLSTEEVQRISRAVVAEAFERLGIDQDEFKEIQADMLFVRTTRTRYESVSNQVVGWIAVLIASALAGLTWLGFAGKVKGGE